jgi:SpoIIAA-like
MIETLQGFPENTLAFACHGHVTRADYEKVLVPAVEQALKAHDKVRLYYQIGTDFAGIDPGAVMQDMKVGLEHWRRWERIAVVTDVEWIKLTMKTFSFLMPGEMKTFATAEAAQARDWVTAE